MGYQHQHIPVYTSQEGFDLLAPTHTKQHAYYEQIEKKGFEKYLPRSVTEKRFLDLGAGDGRLAKPYTGKGLTEYTCVDISPYMLKKRPKRTQELVADIATDIPDLIPGYDMIFAFHVFLHLQDLEAVFTNISELLGPKGVCIIAHHNERRAHEYVVNNQTFKIHTYFHSDADIRRQADRVGMSLIEHPMDDTCFFILRHPSHTG